MKVIEKLRKESGNLWNYCLMGLMFGFLYAMVEHFVRILIGNPIAFLPLGPVR